MQTKVRLVKAVVFPVVMYRGDHEEVFMETRLSTEELMNCGAGKDLRVLGLQGNQASPS